MTGNDRRIHTRTAMSAKVKVLHESLGEFVFSTRDISEGGVSIAVETEPFEPLIGGKVQVQGLPVPTPVLEMVIVRKTIDGFGLQFADE